MKSDLSMNRGYCDVAKELLHDPAVIQFLKQKMTVVKTEHDPNTGVVEFWGYSSLFRRLTEGEEVPFYVIYVYKKHNHFSFSVKEDVNYRS